MNNNNEKNNVKKNRKNRNKKNKRIIILLLIFFILILVLLIKNKTKKDVLIGSWTTDGNTVYEFYGNGNGALIVPSAKHIFSYEVKGKKLYIDFKSDNASNSSYEFSVHKDVLTISGIEKTIGTYTFRKQKK